MMKKKKNLFECFSNWTTSAAGSFAAFIIALAMWPIGPLTGAVFKYFRTWQLVINNGMFNIPLTGPSAKTYYQKTH